ncbi:MAG: hypothetical protein LBN08_02315 [Lactobacillales bacterium]|jgi:predicted amidophosphoribosyltransferase|nr:hypothetical protein [Lactobacillales bacterium]
MNNSKQCTWCGSNNTLKSRYNNYSQWCRNCREDFDIIIEEEGLNFGRALMRYGTTGKESYLAECINYLKHPDWLKIQPLNKEQKLIVISLINDYIKEKLTFPFWDEKTIVMPMPSSNFRDVQHVNEIAKNIAKDRKNQYLEGLKKTSSTEAKFLATNQEFSNDEFVSLYNFTGRNVVLIDDTYGNGKSLRAAIKALKKYGANEIYFISLCRNLGGGLRGNKVSPMQRRFNPLGNTWVANSYTPSVGGYNPLG